MKMYDFHSHLGKTRSGDANSAEQMVKELGEFGITKVCLLYTSPSPRDS